MLRLSDSVKKVFQNANTDIRPGAMKAPEDMWVGVIRLFTKTATTTEVTTLLISDNWHPTKRSALDSMRKVIKEIRKKVGGT